MPDWRTDAAREAPARGLRAAAACARRRGPGNAGAAQGPAPDLLRQAQPLQGQGQLPERRVRAVRRGGWSIDAPAIGSAVTFNLLPCGARQSHMVLEALAAIPSPEAGEG